VIITVHIDTETGQVTVDRVTFDGCAVEVLAAPEPSPEPEPEDEFTLIPCPPAPIVAVAPPMAVPPRLVGQPGDQGLQERVVNAMARLLLEKQAHVAALKSEKNRGAA
jgi:hypothetical protein